jgi:DNA polymerase-4
MNDHQSAVPHGAPLEWLFLDFNSYFASVEQQLNPELRGKPVAVVPVMTDSTCAIAASYEAKAFGIKTGTMIYEAKQRCPDLVCIPAHHHHYVDFHHRLLEEIERHIPIAKVCSIDELTCYLGRRWADEAEARNLAQAIKQGIYKHVGEYIRCSIGFSTNRFLAKVATNLHKPDGLLVLRSEDVLARCGERPVDFLPGIGRQRCKTLAQAGIYTVQQLFSLPPKHLRRLWRSVEGERFWYKLHGVELPTEPTSRSTIGHSHVLAPEYRTPLEACRVGNRLLMKASSRLRRLGFMCQAMSLSVRVERGPRIQVQKRFYRAWDQMTLQKVFEDLWQDVRREMPELRPLRLKKIGVTLSSLIPADAIQPELFDHVTESMQPKREELSHAMDAINQRFGKDTVTFARFLGDVNQFTGTKIAFDRIPDKEEFDE